MRGSPRKGKLVAWKSDDWRKKEEEEEEQEQEVEEIEVEVGSALVLIGKNEHSVCLRMNIGVSSKMTQKLGW